MFGVDLATRPDSGHDEPDRIMLAEIRAVAAYRATQAALPPPPPLPDNYATTTPAEQARADVDRRRIQLQAQQVAIDAAEEDTDDVVDAEMVD